MNRFGLCTNLQGIAMSPKFCVHLQWCESRSKSNKSELPASNHSTKAFWKPQLPIESLIKEELTELMNLDIDDIDKAIELLLFVMKKQIVVVLVCVIFLLSITSCAAPEDKVIASLGEYEKMEFFTSGGFQDYTDYAKYYYDSVDFTDNEYFAKIQDSDMDNLNNHLDDFEAWIETYRNGDPSREIVVNYDFDRSLIDNDDYLYVETEWFDSSDDGNAVFASYDVYFFDVQTNTLYYFHNNI